MRSTSPYSRRACWRYSSSKASASPARHRAASSRSAVLTSPACLDGTASGKSCLWPADPRKFANSGHSDLDPLGAQQLPLHLQIAAVAAQAAAGRDDAVARDARCAAAAHDVADRARGARLAGERGDVSVGRDAAWWDAAHDREDAPRELACPERGRGGQRPMMIFARSVNPPSACSLYTVATLVGESANAFG